MMHLADLQEESLADLETNLWAGRLASSWDSCLVDPSRKLSLGGRETLATYREARYLIDHPRETSMGILASLAFWEVAVSDV